MNNKQEELFTPFVTDGCVLKNRDEGLNQEALESSTSAELFSEETKDWFLSKVKEGAELVNFGVHPVDQTSQKNVQGYAPLSLWEFGSNVSKVGELIDRVHEYGAKVFLSLLAKGDYFESGENGPDIIESMKKLPNDKVDGLTRAFVKSAFIAKLIGYDGVQLDAVHKGYLRNRFNAFFQEKTTRVEEQVLKEKLEFATVIVPAIKTVCGDDFAVSIRFKPNDYLEDERLRIEEDIKNSPKLIQLLGQAGYDAVYADTGNNQLRCWANSSSYCNTDRFVKQEKDLAADEFSLVDKSRINKFCLRTESLRKAMLLSFF